MANIECGAKYCKMHSGQRIFFFEIAVPKHKNSAEVAQIC